MPPDESTRMTHGWKGRALKAEDEVKMLRRKLALERSKRLPGKVVQLRLPVKPAPGPEAA